MEAPFFTSPMIETGRYSTLHFLNEGVDGGGASLHFLNEGRTSTLHFLCQEMVFDFPQKIFDCAGRWRQLESPTRTSNKLSRANF